MICYGLIGTTEHTPMPDYAPWDNRPEGWILMNYMKPDSRPDRFGDWYARADGEWIWQKYPDPPFAIAYFQGKLINVDTMTEIDPESLPGNLAYRIQMIESSLGSGQESLKVEVIDVILGPGGVSSVEFGNVYVDTPRVVPIPVWCGSANSQVCISIPGVATPIGVVVSGRRSRSTLSLEGGPFEAAEAGDSVQVMVFGR